MLGKSDFFNDWLTVTNMRVDDQMSVAVLMMALAIFGNNRLFGGLGEFKLTGFADNRLGNFGFNTGFC